MASTRPSDFHWDTEVCEFFFRQSSILGGQTKTHSARTDGEERQEKTQDYLIREI